MKATWKELAQFAGLAAIGLFGGMLIVTLFSVGTDLIEIGQTWRGIGTLALLLPLCLYGSAALFKLSDWDF